MPLSICDAIGVLRQARRATLCSVKTAPQSAIFARSRDNFAHMQDLSAQASDLSAQATSQGDVI